ncbi:MAG: immunity 17 family protein [Mariniblastus sp.]
MDNWLGPLLILSGLFSIAGAALDWNWFMNNSKAWLFTKLFGRNGARVCYILLGLILVAMGIGLVFGLIAK